MMNQYEAAQMIDVSAVRTQNQYSDIETVVKAAEEFKFINVHVLPNWVRKLSVMIKDIPNVYVGAPVGFPSGGHKTEVKLYEAENLIQDGVQEMDIVMNVGRFKSGEYDYVLDELKKIISLTHGTKIKTKVIIELNCLTDSELPKACELVLSSGADFLKTGTGWVPGNANIDRIRKIKQLVGNDLPIKAAGGIRTRAEFDALYDIGVTRFGINTKSAIEIVRSFNK